MTTTGQTATTTTPKTTGFADMLAGAVGQTGSAVCVGLDPVAESLPAKLRELPPAKGIELFSAGVLEAVAGVAAAVKFQSACYERYGFTGMAALEQSIARARDKRLVVVLDAKRGDIGLSARHYAAAAAAMGAHAITVNGYLGPETIEPYLEAGLGVFVLVRTSNPGGDIVQAPKLADGRSVAEMMADHVAQLGAAWRGACGLSDVGAVVGATKAGEGAALRARMPDQIFLVPGYGAQGGTAQDVRALLRPDGGGVLVTASRSVIYAFEQGDNDWPLAVRHAAGKMTKELLAK